MLVNFFLDILFSFFFEEAALLDRLGKHKRGKVCLYVTRLANVDMTVLEQLATRSWERMAERYPA